MVSAARLLLHPEDEPANVVFPTELVVRASTAPAPPTPEGVAEDPPPGR
jgi:hypothetical protein